MIEKSLSVSLSLIHFHSYLKASENHFLDIRISVHVLCNMGIYMIVSNMFLFLNVNIYWAYVGGQTHKLAL